MSSTKHYKDIAFEKGFVGFAAATLLIIGIAIMLTFLSEAGLKEIELSKQCASGVENELSRRGLIGDYIGGVVGTLFSLVGVALLIRTFQEQRISFERERFEARLFEQIRIHRDNVGELSYTYTEEKRIDDYSKKKQERTAHRRKVFKLIFSDFSLMYEETFPFFKDVSATKIYNQEYLSALSKNALLNERNISLVHYAQLDILYCILFVGLSKNDLSTLDKLFSRRYLQDFYKPILQFLRGKPKVEEDEWLIWTSLGGSTKRYNFFKEGIVEIPSGKNEDAWDKFNRKERNEKFKKLFIEAKHIKYYGGHQFRLGHYFRHIYQTVKTVDDSNLFDYKSKYEYLSFLRAQLSTFEQTIFFLNSVSVFGRIWELEYRDDPSKIIPINKQLITKYNLVKNIADDEVVKDVQVSQFYPAVSYEVIKSISTTLTRKQLEDEYE